jgi:hypothetical protein
MPSGNEMADEHAERPVAAQKPPEQTQPARPTAPCLRNQKHTARSPIGDRRFFDFHRKQSVSITRYMAYADGAA